MMIMMIAGRLLWVGEGTGCRTSTIRQQSGAERERERKKERKLLLGENNTAV